MDRDKVLELAREVWSAAGGTVYIGPSISQVEEFAYLVERELRGDAEPVAFEFQHEDTGLIDFVDPQQVEWGFQKNNPRWQLIGPVFRHPAPAVDAEPVSKGGPDLFAEFYEDGSFTGDASEFADCLEEPVALYRHPAPAVVRQLVEALEHCSGWVEAYGRSEARRKVRAALAAAKEAGL